MNDKDTTKRGELVRSTVVFQLKLIADGFRDPVLLPVSLIATVIGLLRGGDEPDREFNQVIDIGRQSEQWINLFGNHDQPDDANPTASIDVLFTRVEEKLKQHYIAAGTSKSAQAEIDEALQAAHEKATEQQSDTGMDGE
ncbi:MAG: hypothetical protein GQ538_01090 [Xanthomonadales bacterium]|nr:hypothetical protein [Xanthomonadales bacterium]